MNTNKKACMRRDAIRDMLQKQEVVTLQEFCQVLHASVATIRSDLTVLEKQGCLRRVRGGAVSTEGTPRNTVYASRVHLNEREKEQIARQAAELLQEDMTVVLDAGTTCARLAQEILNRGLRCTVITASWTAAEILSRSSDVTLQVTGGRLDREHNRLTGGFPAGLQADLYFLSPDGIAGDQATGSDPEESARKAATARACGQVVCLADPSKINRRGVLETCQPDVLVTCDGIRWLGNRQAENQN